MKPDREREREKEIEDDDSPRSAGACARTVEIRSMQCEGTGKVHR